MAKKWVVPCKVCGTPIEYSDTSHQRMKEHGHSRPEYCKDHQPIHRKWKSSMGVSYFDLAPLPGADLTTMQAGWLGSVYHPPRKHEAVVFTPGFDENRFGLTRQKVFEIYEWLKDPEHQVVVVVGPTGSGKSTALPYWLMNPPDEVGEKDFFTRRGQILITQPRILATEKIAKYLGEQLIGSGIGAGLDVGFRHSKLPNADRMNTIVFETDGTLINLIQRGGLSDLSLIMIDEAHERSTNIDQILRLLKKALPLYPHLKLLIVSATINAEKFVDFFGRNTAKTVDLEGKGKFGYQVFFAEGEDALPLEDLARSGKFVVRALTRKVIWLLTEIVEKRKPWGDILGFLQGVAQIKEVATIIRREVYQNEKFRDVVVVHELYAHLPEEEKEFVEQSGDSLQVRVIISTNVAEASLTVEGVVYVVDSGLEFQGQWDRGTTSQKVVPVLISKANARQRWGRSGRTAEGEVYCLYTEKQFNELMLDYPTPAIQRSSMEEVILTSKASGFDDITSGWIDSPDAKELARAEVALKSKGALDSEGSITEYGLLVKYIPYPILLADLVMKADQLGVAIEVATVLPIIKNGGQRRLLTWKWDWDAYTKRDVAQIHRGLMTGCLDDIEFCLKIYSLWSEPLGSEGKTEEEKESQREKWAKANFVNHRVLLDIQTQREAVLEALYRHSKETARRGIQFNLLDRVRMLFAACLPEVRGIVAPSLGTYNFQAGAKPQQGSSVILTMATFPEWKEYFGVLDEMGYSPILLGKFVSEWEAKASVDKRVTGAFSRLFLDQAVAISSRFECSVTSSQDGQIDVSLEEKVSGRKEVEEAYRLIEEEMENEEDNGEAQEEEHPVLSSPEEAVALEFQAKLQVADGQEYPLGSRVLAEVVAYDFTDPGCPVVILEPVPLPDPFDLFSQRYQVSDEVWVEVVGKEEYPGDFRPSLVVKEKESGHEILMEPEDLSFTFSSSLLDRLAVGTTLRAVVEEVNTSQHRVKVTSLPILEKELDVLMGAGSSNGQIETEACVAEVRGKDRVFFQLEGSRPEEGIFFLVSVSGKGLPKPAKEFQPGETQKYKIRVKRQTDRETRIPLSRISEKLHSILGWEQGNLAWIGGLLCYRGRMTQDQLFEYKSYDGDKSFHRALNVLYARSNQLWVTKVVDSGWKERILQDYPVGSKVQGRVIGSISAGLTLWISPSLEAFIPRSLTFDGMLDLSIGTEIAGKVVEANEERTNLILSALLPENDPFLRLAPGMEVEGRVENLVQYGAFVHLTAGGKGLAHVSKNAAILAKVLPGSRVVVRLLSIDVDKRRAELVIKEVKSEE